MSRVLVLVPVPMSRDQLARREAQLASVSLGPGIEFAFRPVRAAPRNYVSHHDYTIADAAMLDAGLDAESEGFDAVCIDTMSDSGVAALRSVLDVPVIGPGRASMLTALMLGERFSVVTMWDGWKALYTKTLTDLGLAGRCASLRAIGVAPDNRNLLGGKEAEVFPRLEAAARRCVDEDGADVILLGSTTMHEAAAYLQETLPVPVVNPGPLTYHLARIAIDLRLAHSRRAYPRPGTPKPELVRAMLDAAARVEPPPD